MRTLRFLTLVLSMSILACSYPVSKNDYLKSYELWIEKIGNNYLNYTQEDWKRINVEFERFKTVYFERFQNKLTTEERIRIEKFEGQYYAILLKFESQKMKNELNSIANKVDGFINEIQK